MTALHRIRLQGPWQVIPPGGDPHATPREVKIPATWRELFGDTAGLAIFRRTFNTPTNLEPEDRVSIRLPEDTGHVKGCSVDGVSLAAHADDPLAYDVGHLLKDFNRLEIQLNCDPALLPEDKGGLWQPVLLEIRSDAN